MLQPPIQDRVAPIVIPGDEHGVIKFSDVSKFRWTKEQLRWLRTLVNAVDAAEQQVGYVSATEQAASIVTTAVPTPVLTRGLYRVSYYVRITQAAATSSSIRVTIRWTDGGVACSWTGPAVTANVTTAVETETLLLAVDEATVIDYEVAYAAVGVAKYKLSVLVESVNDLRSRNANV